MAALDESVAFQWGVCDCTIWAADMRARLRGESSAADAWRGRYSTRFGAMRTMLELGWRSFGDAARDLYGAPAARAGRGDIVLDETPEGEAFGICYGRRVGFVSASGLVFLRPTADALVWET